jgi:pimeloyl-ACP methyl ester carboxylesterase
LPFLDLISKGDEIAPYTCQIEANEDENFDYAAVELWAPSDCHKVRGILCLILHPLGRGGSTLAHPAPWIKLANHTHCALMAVSFAQSDDPTADWCHAERGTGRALFAALDVLTQKTGIPNLTTAPITIAGVCAAGQFAFHLTAFAPNRIAAFVTIGGGKHDLSKVEAAAKIPALIVVTPDGSPYAIHNLNTLYSEGLSRSAPWRCISENVSNYNAGTCSTKVFSFLESSLDGLADSPQLFKSNQIAEPGPPQYLPVSICGKKLPTLGAAQPVIITLDKIDSSSAEKPTCSLEVSSDPDSPSDAIFVPSRDPILHTDVQKTMPGHWKLNCWLDQEQMPIGSLQIELPIRFTSGGRQILGGTKAILHCSVTGEVMCIPRNLNLGVLKLGETVKISLHFVAKNSVPIFIGSVTSTYPWIKMTSSLANGTPEFWCIVTPPDEAQGEGFGGYLQIKLQSPTQRTLRILYYGSVASK